MPHHLCQGESFVSCLLNLSISKTSEKSFCSRVHWSTMGTLRFWGLTYALYFSWPIGNSFFCFKEEKHESNLPTIQKAIQKAATQCKMVVYGYSYLSLSHRKDQPCIKHAGKKRPYEKGVLAGWELGCRKSGD